MAVSDKDVEHVRRAFESFNATERERADEAGIRAHHARWYDPDVEIVNADDWPVPASYRGTEGYVQWYRESYGPYEDVRYAVDFLGAVGDRVVALVTITGRPREEETELAVQLDSRDAALAHRVDQAELHLELGLLPARPPADRDERDDALTDRTEEVDGVADVLVGAVALLVPLDVALGSPVRGRDGPVVGIDDLDVGVVPASMMRPDAGFVLALTLRRVERLERQSNMLDVLVADSHGRTL